MSLQASVNPVISKKQPYGPGIGNAARELRSSRMPFGDSVATALEALLQRTDAYEKALRSDAQSVRELLVTDSSGKVIGAIGEFIFQGVPVTNYFSEIHVGDPLGTGNPSLALFNANSDGSVTVGQNGWLDVLDPYGSDAAWIGTQYDTQAVTGAIASPTTPLVRLTIVGHTLATGDIVRVLNVGGVRNATGIRTVTKINANTIDLQSTVFVGPYTSGGTVDRLIHVTGAVNNGAGKIRLTVAAHGYESGDKVNVQTVGGVPNATGQWIITVITANTLDLVGSTFAGAYTAGGTCLRYFAGGLFQTFAVGTSFANYKLRAFADGSLRIAGATMTLDGTLATITLDPTLGKISVTGKGAFPTNIQITSQTDTVTGSPAGILIQDPAAPTTDYLSLAYGFLTMYRNSGFGVQARLYADPSQFVLANNLGVAKVSLLSASGAATFAGAVSGFNYSIPNSGSPLIVIGASGSAHFTSAQFDGAVTGTTATFDSGSTPANSQLVLKANSLGALNLLSYAADNEQVLLDCEWSGSSMLARSGSVARLIKGAGVLSIQGATGQTLGNAISDALLIRVDLSNGNVGFGGNATPSYAIDATGDINASVKFRVGGTAGIGATRAFGTSLTVNTEATALKGTPGAGQSQFAAVTGVTLNTTSNTWAGGILTI